MNGPTRFYPQHNLVEFFSYFINKQTIVTNYNNIKDYLNFIDKKSFNCFQHNPSTSPVVISISFRGLDYLLLVLQDNVTAVLYDKENVENGLLEWLVKASLYQLSFLVRSFITGPIVPFYACFVMVFIS